jgi:hypothetical protein
VIANTQVSGSYTGVTGTGTLAAGSTGTGFTVALGSSTITGQLGYVNGGCNATTQAGCTNNVHGAPTRSGDVEYWNGSAWATLAGNNSGTQILQETSSGVPGWTAVGAGTVTTLTAGTGITFSSGATCTTTCTVTATGSGAWTPYTVTAAPATGAFTTASAVGRWNQVGKTVFVSIAVTITTVGTAAGSVSVNLPAASNGYAVFTGKEAVLNGKALGGTTNNSSNLILTNYDNTSPIAAGSVLVVTAAYEVP